MGTQRAVTATINLRKGDTSAVAVFTEAEKAIGKARSQVEQFAKRGGLAAMAAGAERIDLARAQVERLGFELVKLEQEAAEARVALANAAEGSTEWEKAIDRLTGAEAGAAALRKELSQLPTDLRESTREVVGFLGDLDTSLQTVAGTISKVGGSLSGVLGGALSFDAGPLGGVAQAIGGLGDAAAVSEQVFLASGALGDLAAKGTDAFNSVTGLSATVGQFATGAGIAGVAVVGLSLVLGAAAQQAEEAMHKAQAYADAVNEVNAALSQGATTSDIDQMVSDANRQIEQASANITQDVEDIRQGLIAQKESLRDAGLVGVGPEWVEDEINRLLAAPLEDVLKEVELHVTQDPALRQLAANVRDYQQQITDANIVIENHTAAINADRAVIGDQIAAIQARTDLEREAAQLAQQGAAAVEQAITSRRTEAALLGEQNASLRALLGTLQEGDLGYTELTERIAENDQAITALTEGAEYLTDETLGLARAHDAETEAVTATAAAVDMAAVAFSRGSQLLMDAFDAVENMSSDQVTDHVAALENERTVIESQIESLRVLAATNEAYQGELDAQESRLSEISQETAHYNDVLLPAIQVREELVNAVQEEINAENELFEQRQRESKLQKDLTAIADQANKARTQVNDTLTAALDTMTSGIADAEDKGKAALAKLDKEWMQSQLKDQAKFIKEEKRQRQDANKELLRAQQDAFLAMREAEEANDVIAFIQAQRRSEQDLQRQQEDIDTEAQRRADDRATEMQEAQAAREAKIAEIQKQTQAEIASIQQRYQESTQQAKKRLDEIDAQEQAQAQARRARDDEEAKARDEQQRRLADQQRRLDEAQAEGTRRAHAMVMEAVSRSAQATAQTAQQAFSSTIQGVGTAVQSVFTQLQSAVARVQSAVATAPRSGNNDYLSGRAASSNPVTAGVNRAVSTVTSAITGAAARSNAAAGITSAITGAARTLGLRSFAEPGVATAPTLGVFGDRPDNIPEAVIPFPPATARALARGEGFGGKAVNVYLQAPIGDGVSRQEVHAELMAFGRIIAQGFPT